MAGPESVTPRHIEWTGAGGDSYLAVVVDEQGDVAEEFWGNRNEVRAWISARSPGLDAQFVPMALSATRKRVRRKKPVTSPR